MGRKNIALLLLIAGLVAFIASQYTEQEQLTREIGNNYRIFPVPIPADLNFAGEAVPFDKLNVRERIDRELLVNTYWQSSTMLILKRSKKYFEVIEPLLKKHDIPDDFKYLAVAESSLRQGASGAGAEGVWQFMPKSAEDYGLEVSSNVDERKHLIKSTEAACRYLKEAHERFGSWTLAAASYNRGINGIQRDISNQKVDNYYDLHLNSETSRYVPRIIAFKAIIEHPENYGFVISTKDFYSSPKVKTIQIDSTIADLVKWSLNHNTTYSNVKSLNPWIEGESLDVQDKKYEIVIPD